MPAPPAPGAARALLLVRTGWLAIVGACACAATCAWIFGAPTVVALAVVIACEETLEAAVVVTALGRAAAPDVVPRRFPCHRPG